MRQIVAPLSIDSDAIGVNTVASGLEQGLAGILDTVFAAILEIVIVRLAIGQRDQQFGTRLDLFELCGQVPVVQSGNDLGQIDGLAIGPGKITWLDLQARRSVGNWVTLSNGKFERSARAAGLPIR